jgi:hypothetical protein
MQPTGEAFQEHCTLYVRHKTLANLNGWHFREPAMEMPTPPSEYFPLRRCCVFWLLLRPEEVGAPRARTLRVDRPGRTLARRANHGSVAHACPVHRAKINRLIVSGIQKYGPHCPASLRAALWPIVTERERGMRWTRKVSAQALRGRLTLSRTAKSGGPDTPTLVSSRRDDDLADDGGKKARSPGRVRRTPLKPLRREGRMSGPNLW